MAKTRAQRLERRVILFAVLMFACAAIALLRPSKVVGVSTDNLTALAPDLDVSTIREIEIDRVHPQTQAPEVVRLAKTSQGWTLPDRFGYPALPGAAARLLDDVADARERAAVTQRADTFDKYSNQGKWTRVQLKDASGNQAADFEIGRTEGTDVFAKWNRGGVPQVYRIVKLRPRRASTDMGQWIQNQVWSEGVKESAMVRIDLRVKGSAPVSLVKRGASSELLGLTVPEKDPDNVEKVWVMISPKPGDADPFEVKEMATAFATMLLADVVARAPSPADLLKFGFDDPEVTVTVWEHVGDAVRQHELVVGSKTEDGKHWYVRRPDQEWVFIVSSGKSINAFRVEPGQLVLKSKPR